MGQAEMQSIVGWGRGSGDDRRARATGAYWTAERRAGARAMPMPREQTPTGFERQMPTPKGKPGSTAWGVGRERSRESWTTDRVCGEPGVEAPMSFPYRTCGRLFFTQGGKGFAGSAAMIAPNILLTAGHCVFRDGWSTNLTFFPSYGRRPESDPAYRFHSDYAACWTAWSRQARRAFDYAMLWMEDGPGHEIGWLGTLWNAPTEGRRCKAIGYPTTPFAPLDGNTMDEAIGHLAMSCVDGTVGLTNAAIEHGISGGPWITDWKDGVRTHVNGLRSFHMGDQEAEYGPYFTEDVKTLMDWIAEPSNRR